MSEPASGGGRISLQRVTDFLEAYGRALSTGDVERVADSWAIPALVLGSDDARAVSSSDEVSAFFRSAIDWYQARGYLSTKPSQITASQIGPRLIHVTVTWNSVGEGDEVKGSERSFYVLWADDSGALRIRLTAPAALISVR